MAPVRPSQALRVPLQTKARPRPFNNPPRNASCLPDTCRALHTIAPAAHDATNVNTENGRGSHLERTAFTFSESGNLVRCRWPPNTRFAKEEDRLSSDVTSRVPAFIPQAVRRSNSGRRRIVAGTADSVLAPERCEASYPGWETVARGGRARSRSRSPRTGPRDAAHWSPARRRIRVPGPDGCVFQCKVITHSTAK